MSGIAARSFFSFVVHFVDWHGLVYMGQAFERSVITRTHT